jgi:hypothetical protein
LGGGKPDVTSLFAIEEGRDWRVQIVWPNGSVHYFGRFTSKKDTLNWVAAHQWLTLPVAEKTASPENYPVVVGGE